MHDGIFTVIAGLFDRITNCVHDIKACSYTTIRLYEKSFEIIKHILVKTAHGIRDLSDSFSYENFIITVWACDDKRIDRIGVEELKETEE